jgi:hypothetical protein
MSIRYACSTDPQSRHKTTPCTKKTCSGYVMLFSPRWKLEIHSRLLCESDQLPESRTSGSERRWFGDGSGGGSWFVKEVIGGNG